MNLQASPALERARLQLRAEYGLAVDRAAVPADRLVVGDLSEAARLDHILLARRIEACVHFAAFAFVGESVREPGKYYTNNLVNTLNLMECLRRHGIGRFVFSSTCATYGMPDKMPITEETPQRPINPYGASTS